MKLIDTINLMDSDDFKDRFRAEYFKLDNRINGLYNMLEKYRKGTLNFTPKCDIKTLDAQLTAMIQYRKLLVFRAQVENIDLTEPVEIVEENIDLTEPVEIVEENVVLEEEVDQ